MSFKITKTGTTSCTIESEEPRRVFALFVGDNINGLWVNGDYYLATDGVARLPFGVSINPGGVLAVTLPQPSEVVASNMSVGSPDFGTPAFMEELIRYRENFIDWTGLDPKTDRWGYCLASEERLAAQVSQPGKAKIKVAASTKGSGTSLELGGVKIGEYRDGRFHLAPGVSITFGGFGVHTSGVWMAHPTMGAAVVVDRPLTDGLPYWAARIY